MSDQRLYRGVTIRRRYRDRRPHGWWLLPEGPLGNHPDRGWVLTLEEAHAEVDGHVHATGHCLFREGALWLGVVVPSRPATDGGGRESP